MRSPGNGDAVFTVALRSDPAVSSFLHSVPNDVDAQQRWEEAALARDDDMPLIVFRTTTSAAVGTAGIYHIDASRGAAEWGRWAIRHDSLAAVESVLLILRVAFGPLSLDSLYSRTLTRNTRVVSLHDTLGFERVAGGHLDVDGALEEYVEHSVQASDMPALQRRLEPLVQRIAAHVS